MRGKGFGESRRDDTIWAPGLVAHGILDVESVLGLKYPVNPDGHPTFFFLDATGVHTLGSEQCPSQHHVGDFFQMRVTGRYGVWCGNPIINYKVHVLFLSWGPQPQGKTAAPRSTQQTGG